jgi:hypothetical protein
MIKFQWNRTPEPSIKLTARTKILYYTFVKQPSLQLKGLKRRILYQQALNWLSGHPFSDAFSCLVRAIDIEPLCVPNEGVHVQP